MAFLWLNHRQSSILATFKPNCIVVYGAVITKIVYWYWFPCVDNIANQWCFFPHYIFAKKYIVHALFKLQFLKHFWASYPQPHLEAILPFGAELDKVCQAVNWLEMACSLKLTTLHIIGSIWQKGQGTFSPDFRKFSKECPKFIRTFLIIFQNCLKITKGCRIFPSNVWRCFGHIYRYKFWFVQQLNLVNMIHVWHMTSLIISAHVKISNLSSHLKIFCFHSKRNPCNPLKFI